MPLEPILRKGYPQPDRAEVEQTVANAVEADPDKFIDKYKQDARSFDGRYVAADLFKETFEQFSASKDSRNRYNAPVHNSAAVLSAEQFRRNLSDSADLARTEVLFLTGIPGAGKTSSVLSGGDLPDNCRMVFEGQLSNPKTSIEKIQQVLDAGLKAEIIAVHAKPENALANTFKRFEEEGRGASIQIMSNIAGGLPDSLAEVHKKFGDSVALRVYDYRDRANPKELKGWENLNVLQSEGNYDEIKQKLTNELARHRAAGTISEDCYRQANGDAPRERDGRMEPARDAKHETDVDRRGLPQGNSEKSILNVQTSIQQTTPGAAAAAKAIEKRAEADGLSPAQRAIVAARVRQNIANTLERGEAPNVQVRELKLQTADKDQER